MRVIETKMNEAIEARKSLKLGNTEVIYNPVMDCSKIKLHGATIAIVDFDEKAVMVGCRQNALSMSRVNAVLSGLGATDGHKFFDGMRYYFK